MAAMKLLPVILFLIYLCGSFSMKLEKSENSSIGRSFLEKVFGRENGGSSFRNIPSSLLLSAQNIMQQLQSYASQGQIVSSPPKSLPTVTAPLLPREGFKRTIACIYNASASQRPLFGFYSFLNISTEICTHAIYLGANLNANNWKISMSQLTSSLSSEIRSLKAANTNLKILLYIGGSAESFSLMAENDARRNVFTSSVLTWVKQFGFDGILLNWDHPKPSDKYAYTTLAQELRGRFAPETIILNIVLPINNETLKKSFDMKNLMKYVDQVYIFVDGTSSSMKAEFAKILNPLRSKPTKKGPTMNMIEGIKNVLNAKVPRHKIVTGISFRGVSYKLGSSKYHSVGSPVKTWVGGGNPGAYTKSRGLYSYYEICSSLMKKRLTEGFDVLGMSPYAYKDDLWIAYENSDSVSIKTTIVRNNRLSGVALWTVDMDDFRSFCGVKSPLLTTINRTLAGYRVPIDELEQEDVTIATDIIKPTTTEPTAFSQTIPTSGPSFTQPTLNPLLSAVATFASVAGQSIASNSAGGVNVFIPNDIKVNCTSDTRKYISHPVFCTKYYRCIHGVAIAKECPDGLHWNAEISNCDWPSSSSRPLCLK